MDDLVWYVAYGSNLASGRLQQWLDRCRDPSPPRGDRALTIGHGLWFGGESKIWTGGRAYVDHRLDDVPATLARAWLLTREQWCDLHALESGPEGRYAVLLDLDPHDDVVAATFTGPEPFTPEQARKPSAAYLLTIAVGLAEAHDLGPEEAAAYLVGRPGGDQWDRDELVSVLTSSG